MNRSRLMFAVFAGCGGGQAASGDEVVVVGASATLAVDEDGAIAVELLATVTPADAGPVTFDVVGLPRLGTLAPPPEGQRASEALFPLPARRRTASLEGAGAAWTYTPDPDVSGVDTVTFTATAGGVTSEPATVTLQISPVNDAPTAAATSAVGTDEDRAVGGRLQAVDLDGDALVYGLLSAPRAGVVELDPATGTFVYTPAADVSGADAFLWSAVDLSGASTGPITVEVTVAAVDDPPDVVPGSAVGFEDTPLDGGLSAVDPDGDAVSWSLVRPPDHGTLTLDPTLGTFRYTPERDRYGQDGFDVVARGGGATSPTATIRLVTTSVNDRAVVAGATVPMDEDAVLADRVLATDVEGDPLVFSLASPAGHGSVALDPSGTFVYTPDPDFHGHDEFQVVATDPFEASAPERVSLEIGPVNDAPALVGGLLTTEEDTPTLGVVAGSDPEGEPLEHLVSRPPDHGTVDLDPLTGELVYRPERDWSGTDTFGVVAGDGLATSPEATVLVVVQAVNDPPAQSEAELVTVVDVPGSASVATTDPEGDRLLYVLDGEPAHGVAEVDPGSGSVEYQPDAGFVGTDLVLVRITDLSASTMANVRVRVRGDEDQDGAADTEDNCPSLANPAQGDANDNGTGDGCDCWAEPFGPSLDRDRWVSVDRVATTSASSSASGWSLELSGAGAYAHTAPEPAGCASWTWAFDVSTTLPPPGVFDRVQLVARVDAGPWQVVGEVRGAGGPIAWTRASGETAGIALAGAEIEWGLEVVADGATDRFRVDELTISCDTDADGLVDCDEWSLPGYDLTAPDADGDGWLDADELLGGSDPTDPDTDDDGRLDSGDNCPTVFNPMQADADANGVGDECDAAIVDDFPDAVLDPENWVALTGDGALVTTYSRSATRSVNLGGGVADLEAQPRDWASCPAVGWELWVKEGPETPDSGDHFTLQVWTGSTWANVLDVAGRGTTSLDFLVRVGSSTHASLLRDGARTRFHSSGSGSGSDDWFLDDLVMGCDRDRDGLPAWSELNRYGTSDGVTDSDGDGVLDGAEVIAGTDPADRLDF